MMKHYHVYMPNYVDSRTYAQGYLWRCFDCGRVRKTTPADLRPFEKLDASRDLRGLIAVK